MGTQVGRQRSELRRCPSRPLESGLPLQKNRRGEERELRSAQRGWYEEGLREEDERENRGWTSHPRGLVVYRSPKKVLHQPQSSKTRSISEWTH